LTVCPLTEEVSDIMTTRSGWRIASGWSTIAFTALKTTTVAAIAVDSVPTTATVSEGVLRSRRIASRNSCASCMEVPEYCFSAHRERFVRP
jgi:hypothetical protein